EPRSARAGAPGPARPGNGIYLQGGGDVGAGSAVPRVPRGRPLIEDLHAKFLPQFIKIARTRLALAITAATQPDQPEPPSRELHTLVGEAGLLGLGNV